MNMKLYSDRKRLFCGMVLIMLLLPILLVPVSAASYVSLDSSPVEKDLESLIGKEALSKLILDETVQTDDGAQFLSVIYLLEHGFDQQLLVWDYYGLYLYIYNPSGKPLASTTKNCVEMQVDLLGGGRTEVVKYPLKLLNFSENRVLYKYKITGIPISILKQMKMSERGYHIVGMEFQFSGKVNPKDYNVSVSYTFTGFNAGFDSSRSEHDTLRSGYEQLETVEVELHPTSWMSATSDRGEGYRYEVSGVYFAIPNYYLKTYGNWDGDDELKGLYAVSGVYKESRINGLVTDNQQVYNNAQTVAGKSIKWYGYDPRTDFGSRNGVIYRDDFPFSFVCDPVQRGSAQFFQFEYAASFNTWIGNKSYGLASVTHVSEQILDRICIPFYSETDQAISVDVVSQALAEYSGVNYRNTDVDEGRVYGNQTYTVTADDPPMGFTELDYSQENPFWAWWHRFTDVNYGDQQAKVEWLQRIDLNFLNSVGATETAVVAGEYYIGENDVAGLRKLANSSAVQTGLTAGIKGATVYLMHFAKTDYYTSPVAVFADTESYYPGAKEISGNHYYYERTVFEDFDILEFTFKRENGTLTKIPVIASPVNITGGLPAPEDPNGNPSNPGTDDSGPGELIAGCTKTYGDLNGWAKLIVLVLGVVLIALLFGPLAKLLAPLFGFVGKAIGGLFKGIGSLFRGGSKAASTVFNAKEKSYDAKRKRTEDRQADTDRERKQKYEDSDRATTAEDRKRKQKYEDEDRADALYDRQKRNQRANKQEQREDIRFGFELNDRMEKSQRNFHDGVYEGQFEEPKKKDNHGKDE